ncbi:MAG: [FeFe] hydrogenase H-cluster radical SAM maturase HydG [Treponema sp.]|jgi:2-iminoacetate synthase|nr:[FeFe] hydrogenase H-cluster radical SAM maturase HydG [Treponema sp.]
MYDVKSAKADEFISHEEILATMAWVEENRNNKSLIDSIMKKAENFSGLNHREAALLLESGGDHDIFSLAKKIKDTFYGNRIVLFAPLYLSNYCVNGCLYCPYNCGNKNMPRKKLTQEEITNEVIALQNVGHKRLVIESGEDAVNSPIEYILESIKTIYSVKHKNGAIRRLNVNIAATTVDEYKMLKAAGIGTYILFQETYNKEKYEKLHPSGPKSNYAWHTEALDRAMEAGLDDVGVGVLFGLDNYLYDFIAMLMHAEHLEAAHGVGPHTMSVPRLRTAEGISPSSFGSGITDDTFAKIVACLRISVPYTGIIVSTRESEECRKRGLDAGVSQISGGSRTSVGGYEKEESENTKQFDIRDNRSLEEVVRWLIELNYIPSFCTACYRQGRTGDRFMSLCKSGQILNYCHPNALMTLQEYLLDYSDKETQALGVKLIENEIGKIPNEKIHSLAVEHLEKIKQGNRDFRV